MGVMKTSKSVPNQKDTKDNTNKDSICNICAQNVPGPEREEIFAFGKCDHFVCYVCSTRMRVICDQSDCPICREKLDTVIFSNTKAQPYDKFNLKTCISNEKYKIYFQNEHIKDAFNKLLRYECQECLKKSKQIKATKKTVTTKSNRDEQQKSGESASSSKDVKPKQRSKDGGSSNIQETGRDNVSASSNSSNQREVRKTVARELNSPSPSSAIGRIREDAQGLPEPSDVIDSVFSDVFGLKNHLRYVHRLRLCDLCLTHNKLFPFEFSYYDGPALNKHTKEGQPKTSHRGHPDCALCRETFFNNDELIQHMSREHYSCHLCGRHDSNMRIYFPDYVNLREHFKQKHFLCERGNCRDEPLTSAFDNRIDFQLHMVQVHGNPSAGLSRGEARQQRTITLDSAPLRGRPISPGRSMRQNLPPNAAVVSTGNIATANSVRQQQQRPESIQMLIRQQRLPSRAEFPALGHNLSSSSTVIASQTVSNSYVDRYPSLAQTSNVGQPGSSFSQHLAAGPSRSSFVRTAGGGHGVAGNLNEMDFPPLPEQPKQKGSKKSNAQNSSRAKGDSSEQTLDQLINSSLTLSSRRAKVNSKKSRTIGGASKPEKNVKHKPLKIQLSGC